MTRYPAPDVVDLRDALQRHRPELASREIKPLGEGWDFCAFAAGDQVIRVPKVDVVWTAIGSTPVLERFQVERELQTELSRTLPLPIPLPKVYSPGPNGLPFSVYELIPGVPLRKLTRPGAPGFGATLGRFLRALHSFPVERAREIGIDVLDGTLTREKRIEWYEELARRVFPLLSCETRSYTTERFEAFLNDAANFAFEPSLVHSDIEGTNLLANPDTGELTGVIDFGDAHVGDPASDFTWPLSPHAVAPGITDQLPELLRQAGVHEADIRQRCEFYKFCWPLHEIIYGQDIEDEDVAAEGIRALNASVPAGVRCN